ncbi:hypothetical protein K458DRAFT_392029 [Lentithecium fluviatile CBS 122367]|uniref:Uncharacterized protein n=1 Tax=Lentithecium fluviatile CBS 122367 TaxID=1168545 RepID=A0A6G1ITN8_9PLEO|nr:hypothetical protein K458DRAFT_392029 [Lentithecium fluviatile CBS 122367]
MVAVLKQVIFQPHHLSIFSSHLSWPQQSRRQSGIDCNITVTYTTEAGEVLVFAIISVAAGELNITNGNPEIDVQGEPDQTSTPSIIDTDSSFPLPKPTRGVSYDIAGFSKSKKYFAYIYFKRKHETNPNYEAPYHPHAACKLPRMQNSTSSSNPDSGQPDPNNWNDGKLEHNNQGATHQRHDDQPWRHFENNVPHNPNSDQPDDSNDDSSPNLNDAQAQDPKFDGPQHPIHGDLSHHSQSGGDPRQPIDSSTLNFGDRTSLAQTSISSDHLMTKT